MNEKKGFALRFCNPAHTPWLNHWQRKEKPSLAQQGVVKRLQTCLEELTGIMVVENQRTNAQLGCGTKLETELEPTWWKKYQREQKNGNGRCASGKLLFSQKSIYVGRQNLCRENVDKYQDFWYKIIWTYY